MSVDIATQKHQGYGEKSTIRYNEPMTIPNWTLQDRIRKAREHAGLKQAALAEMIPVARNTLSRWESGAFKPSGNDLDRLAEITAVDRTWLETGVEPATAGDLPASLTVRWTPDGIEVDQ